MAFSRRGFRRAMVGRHGRKTFWLSGAVVRGVLASASSATIVTSLNAAALALRPFTIVRTRGVWHIVSDQLAAVEQQETAYGAIVVSEEALAVGITAVPTPIDQDSSSWILFDMMFNRFDFVSGVGFEANSGVSRVVDSKAMRKVEEGQQVIEVIQNSGSSDGVTVTTYQKTLIKLH